MSMFYVLAASGSGRMRSNPFQSKNPQMAAQKGCQNKASITYKHTHTYMHEYMYVYICLCLALTYTYTRLLCYPYSYCWR